MCQYTRLKERAEAITLGNPDMGPMVSKEQMETVLKYIEIGKAEGATCVSGGHRYTDSECADGFFIAPTIFDHCKPDMRIVCEEIFGPVDNSNLPYRGGSCKDGQ